MRGSEARARLGGEGQSGVTGVGREAEGWGRVEGDTRFKRGMHGRMRIRGRGTMRETERKRTEWRGGREMHRKCRHPQRRQQRNESRRWRLAVATPWNADYRAAGAGQSLPHLMAH